MFVSPFGGDTHDSTSTHVHYELQSLYKSMCIEDNKGTEAARQTQ